MSSAPALLAGKFGVVFGFASHRSLAWAIAQVRACRASRVEAAG
jgi:enoyl-[acyl-carrier-protein] reductase (NADH)